MTNDDSSMDNKIILVNVGRAYMVVMTMLVLGLTHLVEQHY
jgi:hypothetical protein